MERFKCGWCRSSFKAPEGLIEHMATKLAATYLVLKQVRNFALKHSDIVGVSVIKLAIDGVMEEFDTAPALSEHEIAVAKRNGTTIRRQNV
jgi:hypothetical protein